MNTVYIVYSINKKKSYVCRTPRCCMYDRPRACVLTCGGGSGPLGAWGRRTCHLPGQWHVCGCPMAL